MAVTVTTYYVDFAAGNDANPGTFGSPFRTVQFPFSSFMLNPGDIVEIKAGTYTIIGKMLEITNYKQGNASSYVTVQAAANTTLNITDTPVLGHGSCRFLRFKDLNFNVDPTATSAYGIFIDGRDVVLGDALGAAHISVENCTIKGDAGYISRSGIMLSGGDYLQVIDCEVGSVAANALAVGGIVIRQPYSFDTTPGIHVRVERNLVYLVGAAVVTDGDHRDGIVLQDYHTDQPFGGSLLTSRLIGDTLVSNNIVVNTAGRGIAILKGGLPDSLVGIINNTVIAPFAMHLGGSVPQCGLGGYGMHTFSSVTYFNNVVVGDLHAFNFEWLEWDVLPGAIVGARNWSYNGLNQYSPLTTEPSGWLYGTTDPTLVNSLVAGLIGAGLVGFAEVGASGVNAGDYAPKSTSPLVAAGFLTFNGWMAPTLDINGTTRTGPPTIGAIQINSGAGALPVCDFTFTPELPGAGSAVEFTDTSTHSPNSFQWSFGDGYESFESDPVHTYITGGDFIVTHVVSNEFGASTKVQVISVAARG